MLPLDRLLLSDIGDIVQASPFEPRYHWLLQHLPTWTAERRRASRADHAGRLEQLAHVVLPAPDANGRRHLAIRVCGSVSRRSRPCTV